jgi:hypothetical protein
MSRTTKAFDNIEIFVRSVIPAAKTQWIDSENLQIVNGTASSVVHFERSQLDDFEAVLVEPAIMSVPYSNGVKNDIQFRIYIALGFAGMLPDVRISALILQDQREWLTRCRLVNTRYRGDEAKSLYDGLKAIEGTLMRTLNPNVKMPEVERELEIVRMLTSFYDEHQHLMSPGVTLESLSYLKAAMVYSIMVLENIKANAPSPRAKRAFDGKIYEIVQQLQATPYDRIKLPEALYDFVAERRHWATGATGSADESRTQAPLNEIELDALLAKLSPRFKERRLGAWETFYSENPDRLSQAANSMVELLKQVLAEKCRGATLDEFLKNKYPSHQQTDWVERTRAWISGTKSGLEGTKHETNAQSIQLTEALMRNAESIMLVIVK